VTSQKDAQAVGRLGFIDEVDLIRALLTLDVSVPGSYGPTADERG
jgi:hypothetical protein